MFLVATVTQAQINIQGSVFGGARQANVGGETNVNIGAEKHDVIINAVFGGNDISGIVGEEDEGVDAHVTTTENGKKLFIGQLFGGGNGDYTYKDKSNHDLRSNGKYIVMPKDWVEPDNWDGTLTTTPIATSETAFTSPVLGKVNLNLGGGTFGYVYGGGNNATVSQLTFITINNTSNPTPVTQILNVQDGTTNLLTTERLRQMGINTAYYNQGTEKFLFSRVFGGNNKAPMAIRPTWELQAGSIENLYSGGNEGEMTSEVGLLLEIDPKVPDNATAEEAKAIKEKLIIDNVFGGCRKADVHPDGTTGNATDDNTVTLDGYHFPKGLSARVLVRGGKINNVYGGNDVKGRVYGGNAVGVYTSISGNIYGGGNGSYPYTDNPALEDDLLYGDFYYNPETVLSQENVTASSGMESVTALNLTRPNAEQVSISVRGTATEPTVIGGAIYCGGNSATLKKNANRPNPRVELKIGSYMIADKVFLGNNGENMIKYTTETDLTKIKDEHVLNRFKQYVNDDKTLTNTVTVGKEFNSIDLTDGPTFAKYMDGCALDLPVKVKFIGDDATDDQTYKYEDYTSYIGSFYCGGNVGSMTMSGKSTINFDRALIVYSKVVGGCNNAYVQAHSGLNAAYQGGIIGSEDERGTTASNHYTANGTATGAIKDRLELNFGGLKIQPLRMPENGVDKGTGVTTPAPYIATNVPLVWNTIKLGERDDDGNPLLVAWNNSTWNGTDLQSTMNRRFNDGNIYGGCCQSGIVNGNVIININQTVVDRTGEYGVFDEVELDGDTGEEKLYNDHYRLISHKSGVILGQQGMDVLGSALNIFGGGKGLETEIWGSATINLKEGYVFQIFGGSEQGAIGKRTSETKDGNGRYTYTYDSRYSTYVNLHGKEGKPGVSKAADGGNDPELAEAEFLYGGGFEGAIAGDTHINLGNGRIFNSFAGSCNADIQGHTETYIGKDGFPYVRDYVYGGNDLGGCIIGGTEVLKENKNFKSHINNGSLDGVYKYNATSNANPTHLYADAYIEYIQGRVEKIFGGCYGVYDYTDPLFGKYFYDKNVLDKDLPAGKERGQARDGYCKPKLDHAFINFRPMDVNNPLNTVGQIYGAGQGILGEKEENTLQNSSYILIDVPQTMKNFKGTEIFGAGECGGVGMYYDLSGANSDYDKASAIIDLLSGEVKATYGGSYKEGITRRTVVNVPTGSTIKLEKIFGGAYGVRNDVACDVYESNVNWNSADAIVGNYQTGIYGGNNAYRRTLYSKVNISAPVYYDKGNEYYATVYGAGFGEDTWAQYTEVNLNGNEDPAKDGAKVYEVYGGSQLGKVMNKKSVDAWKTDADTKATAAYTTAHAAWEAAYEADPENTTDPEPQKPNSIPLLLEGYTDNGLANALATYKYNTNVRINKGAVVCGYMYNGKLSGAYAYGGGLGDAKKESSGDVYGTTFIGLYGGRVVKDIYAAGTVGSVNNRFNVAKDDFDNDFIATANAYIEGGTTRNVYGGGWEGSVGYHVGDAFASTAGDIPGETNVVIGILKDNLETSDGTNDFYFYHGIPSIERNAYGGGEGGAVWGSTHVTFNNGYIGYTYNPSGSDDSDTENIDEHYEEKIIDETVTDTDGHVQPNSNLDDSGCIFGGGYIDNSNVDVTNIKMYGGHVRNAIFGGGEVAAVGRGKIHASGTDNSVRTLAGIYKAGKTNVELIDGHVHRNVFGGGRGYNNLGETGTKMLFSDGYVFGQTEVHIHGGEVGTVKELAKGNGNVFGGGDIGYVYSAYEDADGNLAVGKKSGTRYDNSYDGYYYKYEGVTNNETNVKSSISWSNGVAGDGAFVSGMYLTEDCKVLIEPRCKVTAANGAPDKNGDPTPAVTINNHNYFHGDYVPIDDLNTLGDKGDPTWASLEANLDDDGIIIHNAVFAGGNTTAGSSLAHANATSVFGNATASIHDVYHRDLITIGTDHVGGLYGDGNLTFVDGYRGLNITNYGTDYYYLYEKEGMDDITYDDYLALRSRERDYYEIRYKCIRPCTDKEGNTYHTGVNDDFSTPSILTADEIKTLFSDKENPDYDPENPESGPQLLYDISEEYPNFYNEDGSINTDKVTGYWEQNGVCSIYAGRIMNTIQRADFCGVFGSRMVMQGARDRVPEVVDYTNYTINRVREVSLNKKKSTANDSGTFHGNYFGIYNVVNFLGALTSDFDFGDEVANSLVDGKLNYDKRTTANNDKETYEASIQFKDQDGNVTRTITKSDNDYTFYNWKKGFKDDQRRNNGSSHNKVALASGVYLELTTELSTGKDLREKDWGLITGVVELDLINVQQGMGGGFVYAKNVHGVRTKNPQPHATLTALNADAVTRKDFTYDTRESDTYQREWQTSGNFVHSTQIIIDDCYNESGQYMGEGKVPAHYWFIKGKVYVYDQLISAYTGVPNAYSETVDIPLTITAASHGTMKLLDVKPNKYAYWNTNGQRLGANQNLVINNITYTLNQAISWWEWNKLTPSEQALFEDETFVVSEDCKIGTDEYKAGYVLDKTEYNTLKSNATVTIKKKLENGSTVDEEVAFTSVFRSSNNVSHDTGYILTYKVNNPIEWDTWYTEYSNAANDPDIVREKSLKESDLDVERVTQTIGDVTVSKQIGPNAGPTYRLNSETGSVLGQQDYKEGNLISDDVYFTYNGDTSRPNLYPGIKDRLTAGNGEQAEFDEAWIMTKEETVIETDEQGLPHQRILNPTYVISKGYADNYHLDLEGDDAVAVPAYISTKSIQLSSTEFITINEKMTLKQKESYITRVEGEIVAIAGRQINKMSDLSSSELAALSDVQKKNLTTLLSTKQDLNECIVPAYICTQDGRYGGNYYEAGKNYRGLEAWSSMSATDKNAFTFNYDALDLLIDKYYSRNEGEKYQYDGDYSTEEAVRDENTGNKAGYSVPTRVNYSATYHGSLTSTHNGITLAKGTTYTRDEFEKLPNEQRHYSSITVEASDLTNSSCTVYVVSKPGVIIGNTPYAVGSTIDPTLISPTDPRVTPVTFTSPGDYYFCREKYKIGENTEGVIPAQIGSTGGIQTDEHGDKWVEVGTVISDGKGDDVGYTDLKNYQKNFTIHGIAPTETSTLYVSRFSDIKDLSAEKIITVIYEYDYEESDEMGTHITPISERHVVNIHIQFKSGLAEVEDIKAPQIVIPGDLVTISDPKVNPGSNEITDSGWELYTTKEDAESRTNAVPFSPRTTPLYWYQNGYFVRFYALTNNGGKSYSNYVNLSVANYHDLTKVMEDKTHHYYVDSPDVGHESKIYITDGTEGMNQLKDFFNLSIGTPLTGHAPLDDHVYAGRNLEFIMQTNVKQPSGWTSIARGTNTMDPCFEGVLHGDGHYISGLSESLFGKLCGEVYNLGVMGSFTGAGIAETGGTETDHYGYVENCWVSTSSTAEKTSKPVFGSPQYDSSHPYRIVNCYYMENDDATAKYTNHTGTPNDYGIPTRKNATAFYNGEVAYDLNGFYLYKRYRDNKTGLASSTQYQFYTGGDNNTVTGPTLAYYSTDAPELSSSGAGVWNKGYVEDRYADGDFRYANGAIPEKADDRSYTNLTDNKVYFYPIWPDDYIFFGQMLSYDWDEQRPHEEVPSPIVKKSGRLTASDKSNRVYRAPAYYGSKVMGSAHFNPDVNLVAQSKPRFTNDTEMKDAYPGMTAIDFAGHQEGHSPSAYKLGLTGTNWFYPPLLDDDGLQSIVNTNETPNLVVYAPAYSGDGYTNGKTYTVLNNYFTEPVFENYYDGSNSSSAIYNDTKKYNRVYAKTEVGDKGVKLENGVHGHLVQSDLITTNDHLLVDKKDFNCPISYDMGDGFRMWYQRIPDTYVEPVWSGTTRTTKGWESVSLPFTAELVTTVKKGEITHFYEGSAVSKNGTKTKIGHEYWLRKYRDINPSETNGLTSESTAGDKAWALFTYPGKSGDTEEMMDKEMKNSFLWDYYYMNANATAGNTQKDKNGDDYLYDPENPETRYKDYYKPDDSGVVNTFKDYALLTKAIPYLIGFPGKAFYEFDLSGNFDATTTADDNPDKVLEKTITFASKASTGSDIVTIGVSDDETEEGVSYEVNGVKYIFTPSYMNTALAAGTDNYTLSTDGSSYNKVPATGTATEVYAFRPYFTSTTGSGARNVTRTILFSNDNSELQGVEEKGDPNGDPGTLRIYSQKHKIVVESALTRDIDVRIVNAAGITVNTFTLEPGETVETRIINAGVYIVQSADGRYIKKLAVK